MESDLDEDGFAPPEDCADTDPRRYPGAADVWYDGVDSNCDYANDYDADGDGGMAIAYWGDDCDDSDPGRYALAPRVCGNLIDDDCDDLPDCDLRGEGLAEELNAGVFTGTPGSDAGYWLDAGDVDGDGHPDLLVAGSGADLAFLFKGPLRGGVRDGDEADAQLPGGTAGATLGDFDGDGLADVAASSESLFTEATTRIWSANMFDPATPSGQLVHAPGDGESHRVAAGDLDGDGIDDLLLGGMWGCHVTGWDEPGCIEVFRGPLAGVFDDTAAAAMILSELDQPALRPGGSGLDASHDLTGDGLADVALADGSLGYCGKFYVLESPVPPVIRLDETNRSFVPGGEPLCVLAHELASGDLNDDGQADLVLATSSVAGTDGTALVFAGPLPDAPIDPAAAVATASPVHPISDNAVDVVGDFDADGVQDLAIASYDDDLPTDAANYSVGVYYAPQGAVTADFVVHDTEWGPRAVRAGGDVDGDGVDDLFAGSPGVLDTSGANAGGAYLILGVATGY